MKAAVDSSVITVTRLQAERRIGSRFSTGRKDFSCLQRNWTVFGARPSFLSKRYQELICLWIVTGTYSSSSCSADVRNAWNYTSTPPYVFTVSRLTEHKAKFVAQASSLKLSGYLTQPILEAATKINFVSHPAFCNTSSAVPCCRRLVGGLAPRKRGFDPNPVRVVLTMDVLAMRQGFLLVLRLSFVYFSNFFL